MASIKNDKVSPEQKLVELINEKRAAGLSEADATIIAKAQLSHDAALAKTNDR